MLESESYQLNRPHFLSELLIQDCLNNNRELGFIDVNWNIGIYLLATAKYRWEGK